MSVRENAKSVKKVICIVLASLVLLCSCTSGNTGLKEFASLDDYINEYQYHHLRDDKHPEKTLYELAQLFPIDYQEWEMKDYEFKKSYEFETNLFGGNANISTSDPDPQASLSIYIDLYGAAYAEAYYTCERLLKNVKDYTIRIDGIEAHEKALDNLFESFDTSKPFSISWRNIINEKDYSFSVGYYISPYSKTQSLYIRVLGFNDLIAGESATE